MRKRENAEDAVAEKLRAIVGQYRHSMTHVQSSGEYIAINEQASADIAALTASLLQEKTND